MTESTRTSEGRDTRRPLRSDLDLMENADAALEVLHGKWKVHLLCCLRGVSKQVMTDTLRAGEARARYRVGAAAAPTS